MIVPKQKVSKARGRKRRASAWKISTPNLVECNRCGELKVSHKVCRACGTYKGQAVLKVD